MPGKETILEDWSIVAFCSLPEIQKKYHLEVIPFKQSNNRIAFKITGDVGSAIGDIYANKKVGINEYMKSLRSVRNAIYTLRTLKGKETEEEKIAQQKRYYRKGMEGRR